MAWIRSERDAALRRFVPTAEDFTIIRPERNEAHGLSSSDRQVVTFKDYDALMDDIDRIIQAGS